MIITIFMLLPGLTWAGNFPDLSSSWQAERDAASVQVVKMWLSGAPEPLLQEEILRFLDREIKLSIISPDARLLASDPEFDARQIPVSLLLVILRQNGIMIDPGDFFAGKKFFVLAPLSGGRHAAK
ncbi:MAG: hypothetical protein JRJ12_13510 [Deltaproteobacteria bacterium]|nr:hypothetical protein [Deltaproteobacteria bacterium]MBW2072395.1 hypothetical protein [Deltaproteobacteria bacterium]